MPGLGKLIKDVFDALKQENEAIEKEIKKLDKEIDDLDREIKARKEKLAKENTEDV